MGDSPPPRTSRPRSRSRSPPRRSGKSSGGFRWKEKRSTTEDDDRRDRGGLDRGYRNRSPQRERDRERDRAGDARAGRGRDDDRYKPDGARREKRDSRDERNRDSSDRQPRRDRDPDRKRAAKPPAAAAARPPASGGGGEEMIVITVNDRLGTKAQIPCFPSDKIKDLRVLVAARVGRKPHEILLKRQGERPFKDQLSLEDYGISSGVQLDLEVDTGD